MAGTFDFIALRFHFRAAELRDFPTSAAANRLRGALGKNLRRLSPEAYARWFAPRATSGPSGLRDHPRPFVLRAAHLDSAVLSAGTRFCVGLNVFDQRAVPDLTRAMELFERLELVDTEKFSLPFERIAARRIRVAFLTPTELKGADQPEFGVLWARLRDRISALRAFYGAGPLDIDFKAMGERAACVQMTRCEIQDVSAERVSRSTGRRHSLGGFVGLADYEGDLGEFVPYLEIGRHTGVGRQTVWGKGEISVATF